MRRIYESAQTVVIWVGPDNDDNDARTSVDAVNTISSYVCDKVGIPVSELGSVEDTYQDVIFKNHDTLPSPADTPWSSDELWRALVWFYSHPYFTRVWVIQELSANKSRVVRCGDYALGWDEVELVAGYIIVDTAFAQSYGFSNAFCWWVSTAGGELVKRPHKWLFQLYLVSNFTASDARDVIYGLRGLMKVGRGQELLDPDYTKTTEDVYRDSVEAALDDFENTDVLLYLSGEEKPSWVPRWDVPMLFRNPFRFGKPVPWTPAGDTKAVWEIDRGQFKLFLTGFSVGEIGVVELYNERYFCNSLLQSEEGRSLLSREWQRLLAAIGSTRETRSLSKETLTSAAVSLSYGLNSKTETDDNETLLYTFVAYLRVVLDDPTFQRHVPPDLAEAAKRADGFKFGKPVWDFTYPESSLFVTKGGLVGTSVATTEPGDVVFVPLGCTYPLVVRPRGDFFALRGYAFVHGIMHGEEKESAQRTIEIR